MNSILRCTLRISTSWRSGAMTALLMIIVLGSCYLISPSHRAMVSLRFCGIHTDHSQRVECIYTVIQRQLMQGGIKPAIDSFIAASTMYDNTLDVDCHSAVHRVGDMVYFNLLRDNPDISHYNFPSETAICGDGFYHGLFEHMIQDNPRPDFIVRTCGILKNASFEYLQKASAIC